MFIQSRPVRAMISFIVLMVVMQPVTASDEEINQILAKAHAGDSVAQFQLAEKYYRGEDIQRNYNEALAWYKKAADQNHAEAQHQMGYFYKNGVGGLEKDAKTAFEWFHKAAILGYTPAQTQLSIMYSLGIGVEQNKALSRQWSDRVLEKKGLIDTAKTQSLTTKKAESSKHRVIEQSAVRKAAPVKSKPQQKKPVTTAKQKATVTRPGMTREEYKAWRREQARRLVEEANKKAAAEGDWTE